VIDGQTGRLVPLDDADSFAQAMCALDVSTFDPARARANAARFSMAAFPAGSRGTSAF
jgi:hypothetical protein